MASVALTEIRPGEAFRTWDDVADDLLTRECAYDELRRHVHGIEDHECLGAGCYQLHMERYIAEHGITQGIYVTDDGRVLDGHHRVTAARRLGIDRLPLEAP